MADDTMARPAQRLTDQLGIIIEDHPFDRGYWARFNGERCPSDAQESEGWHYRFHEAIRERDHG